MLLPFTHQHQILGAAAPRIFFFVIYHKFIGPVHSRLPVDHRLSRRADLRSCRTTFGPPPELAAPGDYAAGPSSRTTAIDKRTRRPGESGMLTHNMDAKLADIRLTAARIGQPHQAGRPSARFGNICPLRPPMSRRQIFPPRVLAFGAVARIGCVRIAVLSVSGSLELRRRRIKSAFTLCHILMFSRKSLRILPN